MNNREVKALMTELAPVVRQYVIDAVAPALSRLEAMERRLDAMPVPKDGKDADPVEVAKMVTQNLSPRMDALEKALKDIPEAPELPDVPAMVAEAVTTAVAALPEPEKGEPGQNGAPGERGKDGVGLAGAVISRSGELVLTLTDGTIKELGVVVGKDGKDGRDGVDGKDGLGFEDLRFDYDGERLFTFTLQRGEKIEKHEFSMPVVLHRGPYSDGKAYEKGDQVSFGGSTWIAMEDTNSRPGTDSTWVLSAKKGKDGAPGKQGAQGERGPKGERPIEYDPAGRVK